VTSWEVWALFVVTETGLCLTPSVWSNLGILTGNTIYFALSATGLGAILLASNVVVAGYGGLAGRATHLASQPRFARLTNRVAGSLLVTAAVGMAAIRRR